MKVRILDIIDFRKVDALLEGFNTSTGFVTAILDLDGNVLSKSGWRHICTEFHRANPETSKRCTISDTILAGKLATGEKYHFYKCLNGLVDVAVPLVINGEHIANLFSGQFFFEEPDLRQFKKQAETFGFDEKKYLEALENVPVVSEEKVKSVMQFLLSMTRLIVEMTLQKIEQKELDKTIRESEERYHALFENMTSGFVLFEVVQNDRGLPVDLLIVDANQRFEATTGIKLKDSVGKFLTRVLPGIENDSADWIGKYSNVALTGEPIHFEQGSELLDIYYSVTAFQSGPKQCAVTFIDITERKRAEVVLAESEERFRKVFEEGPLGMVMASLNTGKIFNVNKAFCDMLGFTREELIGLTFMEITHAIDREKDIESAKGLQEGRIPKYNTEKRYLKKNGSELWASVAVAKIFSEKDQSYYALGMIEDITQRKLAQEEIIKLNSQLEIKVDERTTQLKAANKELETFTYSVSHDLKAPLRGIDGYSKLLSDIYKSSLNEEAQKFIDTIRRSTFQMNQLIDDLLSYSRLERSELSLHRIRIKDFLGSVLNNFNSDLEDSKIRVENNVPDIEIIADPRGLTIAVRNLLENAIKFSRGTANPLIQIELEEKERLWIISIQDNGIGFDMKYHDRIFEIFQRLQRVEDFPGTGIGLAMVSKAMIKMNGHARAFSLPGEGSTFYLEIPKNQYYDI